MVLPHAQHLADHIHARVLPPVHGDSSSRRTGGRVHDRIHMKAQLLSEKEMFLLSLITLLVHVCTILEELVGYGEGEEKRVLSCP